MATPKCRQVRLMKVPLTGSQSLTRQATYAIRLRRQAAPMGADMLDATEPMARVAPDPDVADHALLLSRMKVSLDTGRDLWNTLFVRREDFHGPRPALMSTYYGKPGRLVWLFPFKVQRVGRLSTRWTLFVSPSESPVIVMERCPRDIHTR
jgi:hypothetical protein